jgi:hypothetical protein
MHAIWKSRNSNGKTKVTAVNISNSPLGSVLAEHFQGQDQQRRGFIPAFS